MSDIVTVDYLLDLFQKLHNAGKGDMKIKCRDNFLYEDGIGINYMNNEMMFQGYLCDFSITQRVHEFCDDIEKAKNKFYGFIDDLESEED